MTQGELYELFQIGINYKCPYSLDDNCYINGCALILKAYNELKERNNDD